jgi:hypothetical protein
MQKWLGLITKVENGYKIGQETNMATKEKGPREMVIQEQRNQ